MGIIESTGLQSTTQLQSILIEGIERPRGSVNCLSDRVSNFALGCNLDANGSPHDPRPITSLGHHPIPEGGQFIMLANHGIDNPVSGIENRQESETILVIDDSPTNLEFLHTALSKVGYKVWMEVNSRNGIEKISSYLPDLILLDIIMPGINGFEACHQLKENPLTKDIPIIFMTALDDTADKVKGFNLGAVDYITKPFQEEEVLARVRLHLKMRKLTQQLEKQNCQLEAQYVQLKQLAEELEQRVAERTAELSQSLKELQETQLQLIHSEKMSALGNLIAGVAHEINNPVGFILGNLQPAREYIQDLLNLLDLYQQKNPHPDPEIAQEIDAIDLEYLREDLPKILTSMNEGIERIRNISTSLRTFSRADGDRKISFNIHDGIDSTVMILKHRLKANDIRPEILVVKDYGQLPDVECFPGQLNQVFMNLLANAIDAVEESNQGYRFDEIKANPNVITIKTEVTEDNQSVVIRIKDNGKGMSELVKSRIFNHLFTTKAVGQGTGLGLSISRQIVVETHSGSLSCNSVLEEGTEFTAIVPIRQP